MTRPASPPSSSSTSSSHCSAVGSAAGKECAHPIGDRNLPSPSSTSNHPGRHKSPDGRDQGKPTAQPVVAAEILVAAQSRMKRLEPRRRHQQPSCSRCCRPAMTAGWVCGEMPAGGRGGAEACCRLVPLEVADGGGYASPCNTASFLRAETAGGHRGPMMAGGQDGLTSGFVPPLGYRLLQDGKARYFFVHYFSWAREERLGRQAIFSFTPGVKFWGLW